MRCLVLWILITISISGCNIPAIEASNNAKLGEDTGFLAYLNYQITDQSTAIIRKVDLENQQLVGRSIDFSTCIYCIPTPNTFQLSTNTFPKFYFMKLPAGTYMFTHIFVDPTLYVAFCGELPIFEIQANKVNMFVHESETKRHPDLLKNLQKQLKASQTITVPSVEAKFKGAAIFPSKGQSKSASSNQVGSLNCINGDKFSLKNSKY
jgi:hypothetical protein